MVDLGVRSSLDAGLSSPVLTGVALMLLCAGAYISVVLIVSAFVDHLSYMDAEVPFASLLDVLALPGGRHAS